MEQIFAPWRIDWVERDPAEDDIDGCPFCVLPDRDADRESRIVARSEHTFVLLNNAPYSPGHVMVIPGRHTGDWNDLSDAELLDHARTKVATIEALEVGMDAEGVNAGENLGGAAAGGSIDDHLHTHLVPRWTGDTNFMPIVSDTKVIVEAIEASYEKLHDAFADKRTAAGTAEGGAVRLEFSEDGSPGEGDTDVTPR